MVLSSHALLQRMHFASDGRVPRSRERVASGELIRVRAGAFLEREALEGITTPWELHETVAVVRLLSLVHNRPHIAFGETAALLHGVPGFATPSDIHVATPTPTGGRPIPFQPIATPGGRLIPSARVVRHHMPHLVQLGPATDSMICVDLPHALVSTTLTSPARIGFVTASLGIRVLVGGSPMRESRGRNVEETVRASLLSIVDGLPRHTPNRDRAGTVIARADAGCESVGEAALLWLLVVAGIEGLKTQIPVSHRSGTYYVDIGIPGLLLAIEFDGRAKYKDGEEGWRQRLNESERQKHLESQGFVVLRFTWRDLSRPREVVKEIHRRLAQVGRTLTPSQSQVSRFARI